MRLALIEDHDRNPRHFGVLAGANRVGNAYNPRCGDKYAVYLEEKDGVLQQAQYYGLGCAVSNASASMMVAALQGKKIGAVRELMAYFDALTTGQEMNGEDDQWKELSAFEGIHQNPIKHRCARLAWEALEQALGRVG